MTLAEAVEQLGGLDEMATIFAVEPWTADSQVLVDGEQPYRDDLPVRAGQFGLKYKYFMEVFVAREFLEGWIANLDSDPSTDEKCVRLIRYAVDDA